LLAGEHPPNMVTYNGEAQQIPEFTLQRVGSFNLIEAFGHESFLSGFAANL
jgi:hypothetical protein